MKLKKCKKCNKFLTKIDEINNGECANCTKKNINTRDTSYKKVISKHKSNSVEKSKKKLSLFTNRYILEIFACGYLSIVTSWILWKTVFWGDGLATFLIVWIGVHIFYRLLLKAMITIFDSIDALFEGRNFIWIASPLILFTILFGPKIIYRLNMSPAQRKEQDRKEAWERQQNYNMRRGLKLVNYSIEILKNGDSNKIGNELARLYQYCSGYYYGDPQLRRNKRYFDAKTKVKISKKIKKEAGPILIKILKAKKRRTLIKCMALIGILKEKAAIPILLVMLTYDKCGYSERWSAIRTLGAIGDKESLQKMVEIMKDSGEYGRREIRRVEKWAE